jgi:hypothetical protein
MSESGDELIAIAALAEEILSLYASQLGQYIAGHWTNKLGESLKWYVKASGLRT